MQFTAFTRWTIWLLLITNCILWICLYHSLERDYNKLLRQYHFQKDCDPGITVPRPFKRPKYGYL
jgi:hypothetical protein